MVRLSRLAPSRQPLAACSALLVLPLAIVAVSGCGNKGPLFIEPDSESRAELEQAEQQINQAAGVSSEDQTGETDPADDDDEEKKPKKSSN